VTILAPSVFFPCLHEGRRLRTIVSRMIPLIKTCRYI